MAVCPVCNHGNPEAAHFCVECGAALDLGDREKLSDDPLAGRVLLDRYRVIRLLGSGAVSRVYLAQQFIGPAVRHVALKVLLPGTLLDADHDKLVKRFYRECETIVALTHPNIIRVYDFGKLEDGTLFIAMEYIEGAVALGELLPLSVERVQRIVTQISDALNEAHAHGIVHRDLKPDNVLLSTRHGRGDVAKVLDFGIAKHVESAEGGPALTERGVVLGTPPYMSPEQFEGGPIDGQSDVYSLGVMTYEMLTGELPFSADSPWEWAARHLAAEPKPLESTARGKDLPPSVRRAVMHALAKDPRDRPTPLEFARELSSTGPQPTEMMSPSPSSFPPQSLPETVLMEKQPDQSRRKRWAALIAGLVGLSGVVTALAVYALGWIDDWMDARPPMPVDTAPLQSRPPGPIPSIAPSEKGGDGGRWFQSVHHVDNASNAQFLLGKADEKYALIGGGGFITVELAPGVDFVADGTAKPDLTVHAAKDNSASYSVEVSEDHHHFHSVMGSTRRSIAVDLDDREVERGRYVRIRNRSRGTVLKLDGIEAKTVRALRH